MGRLRFEFSLPYFLLSTHSGHHLFSGILTCIEALLDLQHVINYLEGLKVVESNYLVDLASPFCPLIELELVQLIILVSQLLFLKTIDSPLI